MNKVELKDYLNMQLETGKINHAQLFYSDNIEEFKNEILQFLYNFVFLNIEENRNKKLSDLEKEQMISQIQAGVIKDFAELDGKDATTMEIREFFSEILEKPLILENKIYIISNFDFLSERTQNVILKVLEEPPKYAVIVLKARNINNIIDTIRSRCQKIYLKDTNNNKNNNGKEDDWNSNNSNLEEIDEKTKKIAYDIISRTEEKKYTKYYFEFANTITKENIIGIMDCLEKIISEDYLQRYIFAETVLKTKEKLKQNINFEMVKDYFLKNIWGAVNENNTSNR